MADVFDAQDYLDWYQERAGIWPRGNELLNRWLSLLDNEHYARHMNMLRYLDKGFDPLPERDSIKHLLERVGHDLAVYDVLPEGTFFRSLLWGGYLYQETYTGIHATVVALVMRRRTALTMGELEIVYSTIDRLLQGGEDWPSITRVPAVTRDFYAALKRIKVPNKAAIMTPLEGVLKEPGTAKFGTHFKQLMNFCGGAHHMITVAHAYRNGHRQATPEDAISAGFALAKLFEVDIRQLPPVVREGKTGYESAC
jgi:hypothetical protein